MQKESAQIKAKNWDLTQEAFDRLLGWLDQNREEAGLMFENIRAGLMKFFQFQGCSIDQECADETLKRAARKISAGEVERPENPYTYFHGIAWNILREYRKSRERRFTSIDEMPENSKFSFDPMIFQSRE